MKIDGSGQRKTQRGVCSRAHGKRDPSDTSYRVAKRSSDRSLTRRPCPQVLQGHLCVARPSSIDTLVTRPLPTGTPEPSPRGEAVFWPVFGTATLPTSTSVPSSRGKTVWNRCQTGLLPIAGRSLARHPRPQVLQSRLTVAKQSSDRSLTRRPCPQVPQCHPRVARLSGTGVKPVFGRCPGRSSARQPSPQVPLWHPGVAKRSSIDASARPPYLQVPQGHLCVARPSSIDTLVTRPRPQALQCHLPVAKQSSIGPFVHEMGPFCGRRGLDRVFLHEMGPFCGRRGPE